MNLEVLSIFLFMLGLIIIAIYFYMQNMLIDVEHFDIKIKNKMEGEPEIKIAQISDVHIPNNAVNLNKIITVLNDEKPDIIAVTGDLIYKYKKMNDEKLKNFCSSLSSIAKTYAVTGNHEVWSNSVQRWNEILKDCDVSVVDNRIEIFEKNEFFVEIIGLAEGSDYLYELYECQKSDVAFPKILLSHRPERFDKYYSAYQNNRPDLILSGHAHGGQFRIPLLNKALYAPDQGIFPKYSNGLYTSDNGVQMIVSRGLGNSFFPLRLHNKIHLPVINLK